jgi:hypothetical protein
MRNLEEIRSAMLEKEILTVAQTSKIKGGAADSADDEKRRPRPGGGVDTHRPSSPAK